MSLPSLFRAVARPVPRGAALLAFAAGLSGCQYLPSLPTPNWSAERFLGVVTPYRVEVVQGNVITSEQAGAVKPGMNRAQVRIVRPGGARFGLKTNDAYVGDTIINGNLTINAGLRWDHQESGTRGATAQHSGAG